MRLSRGGIAHLAGYIERDLEIRETSLHKPHIASLADLAACALTSKSVNTGEWISILPRKCDDKSKERFISRVLSNPLIKPLEVMEGFVPELIEMMGSSGKTVVLMMDQSKVSNGFECLMISARTGDRAIPFAWRVVKTEGNIGFEDQRLLLDWLKAVAPKDIKILLSADRFYGTQALIEWCREAKWQYRIRLKSNLNLRHEGGDLTTGEAVSLKLSGLESAQLKGVQTNIGILHEKGHKEPWIIAMDCKPTKYRTLDYGMRWGIESLFSDFKSRGFGITQTHLGHADRIERLILVLTLGYYWAASTGMEPPKIKPRVTKKKPTVPWSHSSKKGSE